MTLTVLAWTALLCCGAALIHMTIITGAALISARTLRRSAALRHRVLLAGLLGAMLMPLAVAVAELADYRVATISLAEVIGVDDIAGASVSSAELDASTAGVAAPDDLANLSPGAYEQALQAMQTEIATLRDETAAGGTTIIVVSIVAATIWFSGSLLFAIRLCVAWWRVRILVRRADPVDGVVAGVAQDAQRIVRLRKAPRLLQSRSIKTPMAVGLGRTAVLIPLELQEHVSRDELLALLTHEMAHLARRDHLIVLIQHAAVVLLWPHPLIHLINRRLGQSREELCDNIALGCCDRIDYSRLLLRLSAVLGPARPATLTTGFFASKWRLESRIAGILDHRRSVMTRTRPVHAALVAAAFVFSALALPNVTIAGAPQDAASSSLAASAADVEKRIARLEAMMERIVAALRLRQTDRPGAGVGVDATGRIGGVRSTISGGGGGGAAQGAIRNRISAAENRFGGGSAGEGAGGAVRSRNSSFGVGSGSAADGSADRGQVRTRVGGSLIGVGAEAAATDETRPTRRQNAAGAGGRISGSADRVESGATADEGGVRVRRMSGQGQADSTEQGAGAGRGAVRRIGSGVAADDGGANTQGGVRARGMIGSGVAADDGGVNTQGGVRVRGMIGSGVAADDGSVRRTRVGDLAGGGAGGSSFGGARSGASDARAADDTDVRTRVRGMIGGAGRGQASDARISAGSRARSGATFGLGGTASGVRQDDAAAHRKALEQRIDNLEKLVRQLLQSMSETRGNARSDERIIPSAAMDR